MEEGSHEGITWSDLTLVGSDVWVILEELLIGVGRLTTRECRLGEISEVIRSLTITIEVCVGEDRVTRARLSGVDDTDGRSEVLGILYSIVELTDDTVASIEVGVVELVAIDIIGVVVDPVGDSL